MAKSEIYNSHFFNLTNENYDSAKIILPILFEIFPPKTIIDIGCGSGAWLLAASELGVKSLWGIDGDWLRNEQLLTDNVELIIHNLNQPLPRVGKFDITISLEVAEHLPPERAQSFITDLCHYSEVILFSAAIPHQGGDHHINEQWQSYWVKLFLENNFIGVDFIRPKIWHNPQVKSWYKQNTFLFLHKSKEHVIPSDSKYEFPVNIVHPEIYKIRPEKFPVKPYQPQKSHY